MSLQPRRPWCKPQPTSPSRQILIRFTLATLFFALCHYSDPLRGFKGAYLEGGIRTAALVHTAQAATAYPRAWSGVRSSKAGTVLEGIAFVSDWMPTLLDVAGAPVEFFDPDPDVDGVSLWRSFSEGEPGTWRGSQWRILMHPPCRTTCVCHLSLTRPLFGVHARWYGTYGMETVDTP